MGKRSDAARTLYEVMGIPGIASLENQFDSPEHLPGTPGINDLAAGHLDFDPKVTFDSGDRIDRDSFCCHMFASSAGNGKCSIDD